MYCYTIKWIIITLILNILVAVIYNSSNGFKCSKSFGPMPGRDARVAKADVVAEVEAQRAKRGGVAEACQRGRPVVPHVVGRQGCGLLVGHTAPLSKNRGGGG